LYKKLAWGAVLNKLRIATRSSQLALWQATWVQGRLASLGCASELVLIQTQGDREHAAFAQMQGQGFFTKAIQDALLEGSADLAVHSFKDLPSTPVPGLTVAAIPPREDPREVLLVRPEAFTEGTLWVKPAGRVGSSAVRRQAQLRLLRPDLTLLDLRGNVPTRVEKLRQGHYDAIMLAYAGLKRLELDLSGLVIQVLEPTDFVPAPAQGALALECLSTNPELLDLLQNLNDPWGSLSASTERSLMGRLAGGCQLALGAWCYQSPDGLGLLAWYQNKQYQAHGSDLVEKIFSEMQGDLCT
jgi:hydroxymethylbilane synthase